MKLHWRVTAKITALEQVIEVIESGDCEVSGSSTNEETIARLRARIEAIRTGAESVRQKSSLRVPG
jgi:hypothetical protein